MGLRFGAAKVLSAVSTWGLKYVFRRPAANFPGKLGLYADPALIAHLEDRLLKGSVCVVGTNGKTTVTNMLADILEAEGQRVVCNRTGANLGSGVATSLLHIKEADWGVFETDELWLAKILPGLQADYVVLLNLFRDQLDRCGEIDRIQNSIVGALEESPGTVLLYNGDDPMCQAIADKVPNKRFAFGIDEDLGLPQNTVADAQMCRECATMLEYDYRQYGQLGSYHCPNCGFSRPELDVAITDVILQEASLSFTLCMQGKAGERDFSAPFGGHYMVYNIAAAALSATLFGCKHETIRQIASEYSPNNGRLQEFEIDGRKFLLNLAKNPTGFNQNLKLITKAEGPRAVAFFVNDKEADGHDVSWLWDIDFEELATIPELIVFVGGLRANDLQVRLKYAGVPSHVITDCDDLMRYMDKLPIKVRVFTISNYTALSSLKADLERIQHQRAAHGDYAALPQPLSLGEVAAPPLSQVPLQENQPPVVLAHMFPDLLNLYGDGGNVTVLAQRLRWRGIPVEVKKVMHGQTADLAHVDLVLMGGSPDREQGLATSDLVAMRDELTDFVEHDGPVLAICGSYQILGKTWLLDDEEIEGLGIIDMKTGRGNGSTDRLIDNIVLRSSLVEEPVLGYENHAGRTYLGPGVQPFGRVVSSVGKGNNDMDRADGVQYRNLIGTYLHGPLLSKNPQLADLLLQRALEQRARRTGCAVPDLQALSDVEEHAANAAMCKKLGM